MFDVDTGFWWFDVIVWVVSGGAFLGICYLLPSYYRNVIRPLFDEIFGRDE